MEGKYIFVRHQKIIFYLFRTQIKLIVLYLFQIRKKNKSKVSVKGTALDKMILSTGDFSKCEKIRICSHLLKKSSM